MTGCQIKQAMLDVNILYCIPSVWIRIHARPSHGFWSVTGIVYVRQSISIVDPACVHAWLHLLSNLWLPRLFFCCVFDCFRQYFVLPAQFLPSSRTYFFETWQSFAKITIANVANAPSSVWFQTSLRFLMMPVRSPESIIYSSIDTLKAQKCPGNCRQDTDWPSSDCSMQPGKLDKNCSAVLNVLRAWQSRAAHTLRKKKTQQNKKCSERINPLTVSFTAEPMPGALPRSWHQTYRSQSLGKCRGKLELVPQSLKVRTKLLQANACKCHYFCWMFMSLLPVLILLQHVHPYFSQQLKGWGL